MGKKVAMKMQKNVGLMILSMYRNTQLEMCKKYMEDLKYRYCIIADLR